MNTRIPCYHALDGSEKRLPKPILLPRAAYLLPTAARQPARILPMLLTLWMASVIALPEVANGQGQQAAMQAAEEAAARAAQESGESSSYDDEMMEGMEEEYGMDGYGMDGYGSGNAPSKPIKTGPTPLAMLQLFQPSWSPLADRFVSLMSTSEQEGPVVVGPVLRNEAQVAYRYGDLPLALELQFGHMARGGEVAIADLEEIRFSNHFRRPVWHLRWAVSIGIHGDTGADPNPITESRSLNQGNFGRGEFGGDGFGGGGPPDEAAMRAEMESEMMDMESEMMDSGMDDMFGGGGGRSKPQADLAPEATMTDPEANEKLASLLGIVGQQVADGMTQRVQAGNFGMALRDVAPEDETQGYTVGGNSVTPSPMPMWVPGVRFIGEGNYRETSEKANKQGFELLLHFDVGLKESRTGTVQNVSRVKVIDCRTGKTVISSGGMDSGEVDRLLRTNRGTAGSYVNEQLATFWKIIDQRLRVTDMPALTPDIARRRVTQVMGDNALSPLRKLAEIRLFGHLGHLNETEMEQAFAIVGSVNGMTILYGADSQAIEAIREMASAATAPTDS